MILTGAFAAGFALYRGMELDFSATATDESLWWLSLVMGGVWVSWAFLVPLAPALLVVGLLSALLSARATGKGQVVDAAIVDGAALLQAMTYGLLSSGDWTDRREANLQHADTIARMPPALHPVARVI